MSVTVVAGVTTFGALSLALAPSASAADTKAKPPPPTPTQTQTQKPALTRPVGVQVSNYDTGNRVRGAGYHLCGPATAGGAHGAFCPAGTADLGGSRSNESGVITFAKKVTGGQYAVVQAHSPGGFIPDTAVHTFQVPEVTSKDQTKAIFWVLLQLKPKPPTVPPVVLKLKPDKIHTSENQPGSVNVLRNDLPSGSLTLVAVTRSAHGTVTFTRGGLVTYRPATGFVGNDVFGYSAINQAGRTSVLGLVRVNVCNVGPTARDVTLTTKVNTAVGFNPLKYATAPAGDHVRLWAISQPTHGQTVVAGDQVLYIPDAGFIGTDAFTYTVTDGQGACDTAKVTVRIPKTEVLARPPVTAPPPPTLPVTGPTEVKHVALLGFGLVGLGVMLVAAGALPCRRFTGHLAGGLTKRRRANPGGGPARRHTLRRSDGDGRARWFPTGDGQTA
jgi:hypothetical protein